MRNVEGKSLSDIFLDLLHGLRRKRIDEVDRNIVKTSQLQTIDIVIDILLLMLRPIFLSKRLSKVCTPKETRLTGESFKTAILSGSKSPGLASMVNSSI